MKFLGVSHSFQVLVSLVYPIVFILWNLLLLENEKKVCVTMYSQIQNSTGVLIAHLELDHPERTARIYLHLP